MRNLEGEDFGSGVLALDGVKGCTFLGRMPYKGMNASKDVGRKVFEFRREH